MLLRYKNQIFLALAVLITLIGTFERLTWASRSKGGKDYQEHVMAIESLLHGENPYEATVESFSNLDTNPGGKGYAYLPGIMYANSIMYIFHSFVFVQTSAKTVLMPFLMHLPGILANLTISLFFIKIFYKKDNLALVFSILLWIYNPYFFLKNALEGYDLLTIACMVWGLYYLGKDDVKSGVLFALSVLFKIFPVILGPIFLLKAKNKKSVFLSALFVAIFFSAPFMKSFQDFWIYLQGSVLVHGDRFIQGRPYLFYVSYLWDIIFIRLISTKIYSYAAILSGWIIAPIAYLFSWVRNKYVLSVLPFLTFYFFTPVLNRTYTIWMIPLLLVGSHKLFETKKLRPLFYLLNIGYWVFAYWYLKVWKDGFHIHARL